MRPLLWPDLPDLAGRDPEPLANSRLARQTTLYIYGAQLAQLVPLAAMRRAP
jgi:hypothetical protein